MVESVTTLQDAIAKSSVMSREVSRGVQYVHWVMHKCIMVKVGGEITLKVCKKLLNFSKTGGKILKSRGGIINFANQGGNAVKQAKQGEIRNLWPMTKKKVFRNFGGRK